MTTTMEWFMFGVILWGCYLLGEQQTIAILMIVYSSFKAAVTSIYITVICLVLGSGALRFVKNKYHVLSLFFQFTQDIHCKITSLHNIIRKRALNSYLVDTSFFITIQNLSHHIVTL